MTEGQQVLATMTVEASVAVSKGEGPDALEVPTPEEEEDES